MSDYRPASAGRFLGHRGESESVPGVNHGTLGEKLIRGCLRLCTLQMAEKGRDFDEVSHDESARIRKTLR